MSERSLKKTAAEMEELSEELESKINEELTKLYLNFDHNDNEELTRKRRMLSLRKA